MTITLPGTSSGVAGAHLDAHLLAKVSCHQWCSSAPVYSVTGTTTVTSRGRSRARLTAAVTAVLPAGPRSRPSILAIASVT